MWRFLANKIAQSSRIDFLADTRENVYGEEFRKQVEERMNFLTTGDKPRKNTEVVKEAEQRLKQNAEAKLLSKKRKKSVDDGEKKKSKKSKKVEDSDDE